MDRHTFDANKEKPYWPRAIPERCPSGVLTRCPRCKREVWFHSASVADTWSKSNKICGACKDPEGFKVRQQKGRELMTKWYKKKAEMEEEVKQKIKGSSVRKRPQLF